MNKGIWVYKDLGRIVTKNSITSDNCIFCNTVLKMLPDIINSIEEEEEDGDLHSSETLRKAAICPVCGWWKILDVTLISPYGEYEDSDAPLEGAGWGGMHIFKGAIGSLKELDINNVNQPMNEVRDYLSARYDQRFNINPKLFEETVASVFKDLGYQSRVTAYSGDGGIDVILDGPTNVVIGVQVKRYKNSIEVEQIRSLAGALFLGGFTKGAFVTTSKFQSGAYKAADLSTVRGKPIELYDAHKFFDALKIAQKTKFHNENEFLDAVEYICPHALNSLGEVL